MAHSYSSKERTSDVLNEENVNIDFASLLLSSDVLTGLSRAGFKRPSPIQLKAIPLGRCGLDMIVQAKSGTGKTCVFSVIILESLDLQCSGVQALVLAPTREIATQVQGVIQSIGSDMQGLRCHTFIGGTLFGPDRQKLKKCHVAVGTPGRVKQLIEYDVLLTDSIRLFILDEADKLLEEKFQDQINWIYNRLPVNKQMLALSATYPEALAKGLTSYMRDPTFVRLNPQRVALKGIQQFYKVVPGHGLYHKAFEVKVQHLLQLLSQVSFSQCLVFSNLSSRAQNLSDILCERGWPSTCISGNQDQSQRHSAMSMLKAFKCRVLISTDLTARGIDAENVNLIINLDVPSDGKTYMHRIGRAGRFGSKGVAVTFASEGDEESLLRRIQRQCHVSLRHLPDPVPSDLVNSVSMDLTCSESKEEPSSLLEFSDSSQDNPDDTVIDNQKLKEQSEAAIQESNVAEQSCLQTTVDVTQRTSGLGSNHLSQVNERGDSVYQTVCDKACQVDALGLPFKMHRPFNFKIPSLAEKFHARREEEIWTWEKAAKDFEYFMSGCSEPVDVELDNLTEAVQDRTEASMTSEDTAPFAENDAVKYQFEERQRTAPADGDIGSLASEQTGNCSDGEQFRADNLPRPDLEDLMTSISNLYGSIVASGEGLRTCERQTQSFKEEASEQSVADTISAVNFNPERAIEGPLPVAVEGTLLVEVEAVPPVKVEATPPIEVEATPPITVEATPSIKVEATPPIKVESSPPIAVEATSSIKVEATPPIEVESTPPIEEEATPPIEVEAPPITVQATPPITVSNEEHHQSKEADRREVRPKDSNKTDKLEEVSRAESTTEYKVAFSWRPSQNFFSGLLPDEVAKLEIAENSSSDDDNNIPESLDPGAKASASGFRSDSLNIKGDVIKDSVKTKEGRKFEPPRFKKVTQDDKRLSKAKEGLTESKQYCTATSSEHPEHGKSNNGESSVAPQMQKSGQRNFRKAFTDWQASGMPSSLNGRPQADTLVSNIQLHKEASRPDADPIWQSYTNYLKTEHQQVDAASCDESDDSDTDSTRTFDDQESSNDSTGDSVPNTNKNFRQWTPDPKTIAQEYGWAPSPYDPYAYSSWYGVPDYSPTAATIPPNPSTQDYPSQFGLSDYHKAAYGGQYAYWPYAYF